MFIQSDGQLGSRLSKRFKKIAKVLPFAKHVLPFAKHVSIPLTLALAIKKKQKVSADKNKRLVTAYEGLGVAHKLIKINNVKLRNQNKNLKISILDLISKIKSRNAQMVQSNNLVKQYRILLEKSNVPPRNIPTQQQYLEPIRLTSTQDLQSEVPTDPNYVIEDVNTTKDGQGYEYGTFEESGDSDEPGDFNESGDSDYLSGYFNQDQEMSNFFDINLPSRRNSGFIHQGELFPDTPIRLSQ